MLHGQEKSTGSGSDFRRHLQSVDFSLGREIFNLRSRLRPSPVIVLGVGKHRGTNTAKLLANGREALAILE
jgi:hypothetical protein